MGLTPKQKAFADEYLKCGNQTEAAKIAGYKQPHVQGNQTLDNLRVKEYISERQKQIDNSKIASAAEIMQYFSSVMRGDIKEQSGTDTPLAERTKAAIELAKRIVDVGEKDSTGGVIIVNNIPRPKPSPPD